MFEMPITHPKETLSRNLDIRGGVQETGLG